MKVKSLTIVLALVGFISACSIGSSKFAAINITNSQASPNDESVSVFSPSDSVYVNILIDAVKVGDEITGIVTAVDAPGFSPSDMLMGRNTNSAFGKADKDMENIQTLLWFTFPSESDGWPIGSYKIEVYFNDSLDTVFNFRIQ